MQYFNNLTELTVAIKEWGEKTFPDSTVWSTWTHLEKEMDELLDAIGPFQIQEQPEDLRHQVAMEIADVFHLLVQLAQHCQVDLTSSVREKFLINVEREWQAPDEAGVVEHKR